MIGSIIGLLVMIALTTFMAALMQLSAEVLAPRKTLTDAQVAVVAQYVKSFPVGQGPDQVKVEEVEKAISECLANLPRDSSSTRTAC